VNLHQSGSPNVVNCAEQRDRPVDHLHVEPVVFSNAGLRTDDLNACDLCGRGLPATAHLGSYVLVGVALAPHVDGADNERGAEERNVFRGADTSVRSTLARSL
jgi:hypothetical protein